MDNLGDKRQNYKRHTLNLNELNADPIDQFAQWYQDAEKVNIIEPNAMALATATKDGRPSVRIVLLKGFNAKGFVFYSNYSSHKGKELDDNPHAALVFWWDKLQRQIRVEGIVEKISEKDSEKYFHSRPRGSQLSALASPQSKEITMKELERLRVSVEERFADQSKIPLPENWGGYILIPQALEFWQGRENRYHDRFRYVQSDDNHWNITRLAP